MTTTTPSKKAGIFELIGKTKATFTSIVGQAEKLGQKNTKPAAVLRLSVRVPNAKLKEISPELYDFCYYNSGKNTGSLEGIQVVSGEPNLTPWILKMGTSFDWEYEQSGCTFKLYEGGGGKPKHTMGSCTINKLAITCHEGGSTDWEFNVYTSDLDHDVAGDLLMLKMQERDIEVVAPDLVSQQQSLTEEETPIGALTKAQEKAAAGAAKH